jgi:hypothetical protein
MAGRRLLTAGSAAAAPHARRLKIDGLDGKPIDYTADLPSHFAGSPDDAGLRADGGGQAAAGQSDPAKSPETKARRVAAAAKSARKARKGERRARGSQGREIAGTPNFKEAKVTDDVLWKRRFRTFLAIRLVGLATFLAGIAIAFSTCSSRAATNCSAAFL